MKDVEKSLEYKGKEYKIVFNLNVMERIQAEYGTLDKWAKMTDGTDEPDAKALIFGYAAMINEGIDIANEENGTNAPFLTTKQVGRMIWNMGMPNAAKVLNGTVVDSTQSAEKNE